MIIFIKDLLGINPAYNDSIIQFSSDSITDATKAIITVEGDAFVTVPINNIFTFNFKEILKTKINTNRFEDEIIPDLNNSYIVSDSSIGRDFTVEIQVMNSITSEATTKTWYFQRSVEQLPDYHRLSALANGVRVLLPTKNYIDYSVKCFEGYPFDFTINGLATYNEIYFKNITTNQQTSPYSVLNNDAVRVFVSDGANNSTDTDILINSSTKNRIELWRNNAFVANINITKVESECGVYIKWLNSKGSYSYWLFAPIYKSNITPRTIDDFQGNYDNLQNLIATSHIIGKTANNTLIINSKFENSDAENLQDLIYSPAVWMYAHQTPFIQVIDKFDWIGIKVNDSSFSVDNKTSKNKLALTITLPEINTITQ